MKNQIVPMNSKAADVVIPKPTRTEVVEALVTVARQEWEAENEALRAAVEDVDGKILSLIKSNPGLLELGKVDSFHQYGKQMSINVDIKETAEIKRLLKDKSKLKSPGYGFPEEKVRQKIKKAIAADPRRVKALSESPEIKVMLATIKAIFE